MDRTERFYRIDALLRERGVVSIESFLGELGISRATFKRDLEYLRDRLHAPIAWDRSAGGYRFVEPAPAAPRYSLPGLWLNETEIRALLALRELLERVHPGLLGPHVEPLIERARALLGGEGDGGAPEVARRVRILHAPRREVRSAQFGTICEALLARRRVRVVHYSRPRDETLERTLSPQRLVHYRENWYLDAWCHLRNDLRSFALDCVRHAAVVDEPARDIADFTLDRDLGAGYGIFAGKGRPRLAHLRFTEMQSRWVADEVWHSRQEGTFDESGRYELKVPYTESRELVMNILKYGPEVEVLGPPALRAEVADALRAATALYVPATRDADA
ncbi:MAG: WYL domain-containing protein [Immundisolibacterales bacterium]|nr:WYL domain-containing protein [Immundisolibacterales bacterium]